MSTSSASTSARQSIAGGTGQPLATVMRDIFKLSAVGQTWQDFIKRFTPIAPNAAGLIPSVAFLTRPLLIHEYRKVLLHDPQLPFDLPPDNWSGNNARAFCVAMYQGLADSSNHFLAEQVVDIRASEGFLNAIN